MHTKQADNRVEPLAMQRPGLRCGAIDDIASECVWNGRACTPVYPLVLRRRLQSGFSAGVGLVLCSLASCAQGIVPTVQVLPPPGKAFAAFQADQHDCSILAGDQVRPLMDRAAYAGLNTAVVGTALGAGLGAAIGGGHGAGIGAAAGAIGGTGVAANQSATSDAHIQALLDSTSAACRPARGDLAQAPQTVVVAAPPVIIQPAPYVVQPAPYAVAPTPPPQ